MPIQEHLPIVFVLVGPSILKGIPAPLVFGSPGMVIRPETWSLSRGVRSTITHTASNAFLDDFNMGVPILSLSGHTGFSEPSKLAGLPALKLLEALFILYEQSREQFASLNFDPNLIKIYYFDVLNLQALSISPQEFVVERMKSRSLLYFYRMRFAVLQDLGADALDWLTTPKTGNALDRRDTDALQHGFLSVGNQFNTGLERLAA